MDPKKPEDWIIKNNWIVQLKDDSKMNPWEHAGWATRMHKEDPQGFYGVVDVYSGTILKGYDGWFSDKTAEKIRKHPDVSICLGIYLVYLSCVFILCVYLVYLSCVFILCIYLVYLSCVFDLSIQICTIGVVYVCLWIEVFAIMSAYCVIVQK
jgi:hypothetical protein